MNTKIARVSTSISVDLCNQFEGANCTQQKIDKTDKLHKRERL